MTGIFPTVLTTAVVKPLIKKNNLDLFILTNLKYVLAFTLIITETSIVKVVNDL